MMSFSYPASCLNLQGTKARLTIGWLQYVATCDSAALLKSPVRKWMQNFITHRSSHTS